MPDFVYQSRFDVSVETLFQLHERPNALFLLTPPWVPLKKVKTEGPGGILPGTIHHLAFGWGPLALPYHAKHTEFERNVIFTDIQFKGPFRSYTHRHCFQSDGDGASILRDEIRYTPPPLIPPSWIEKKLQQMFSYRHERVTLLLEQIKMNGGVKQKILISGATGLIGTQLTYILEFLGHDVYRLTRKPKQPRDLAWDPANSRIPSLPAGLDTVIHLAGENVASEPWTDDVKARIAKSRIEGTRFLVESLIKQGIVPKAFLCASAVGFYGRNRSMDVDEASEAGNSFLARTAIDWEKASAPLEQAGSRVLHLRFGLVLDPRGGALAAMKLPFSLGLGGALGKGHHFMSVIGMEDVVGSILFLMRNEGASGPYNLVCPEPVSNEQFTKILGKVLRRPTFLRVPEGLLTLLPNRMAEELLLSSLRVIPQKLTTLGYEFRQTNTEEILRYCLGKN